MKTSSNPVLTTQNLQVGYKKGKEAHIVLKDLRLALSPGELVCFLGPNGVGKSTLLRTLSGVQKPLQGQVFIKESPLHTLSLQEKAKKISLVLTERIPGGNLTVLELVALGRHPHTNWAGNLTPEDHTKVEKAIASTELEALIHRKLYTLSDGQLQKAMIARAVAQDSDIMILDEPTAHLDLINRSEIMNLLLNMAKTTQKAILVATHELDLALQTADRLWLAGFDQPILSGIPEDLALSGAIEKTFFKQDAHFDPLTRRFLLPKTNNLTIKLTGRDLPRLWTQYALQRIGYNVAAQEGKVHVHVEHQDGKTVWHLNKAEKTTRYGSIEELLWEL